MRHRVGQEQHSRQEVLGPHPSYVSGETAGLPATAPLPISQETREKKETVDVGT